MENAGCFGNRSKHFDLTMVNHTVMLAYMWQHKHDIPSKLAKLIEPYFDQKLTLLDLGCGHGRIGGSVRERFERVIGFDSDPATSPDVCGDYNCSSLWSFIGPVDVVVSNCAIRKDYTNLTQLAERLKGKKIALRIQGVDDMENMLPKAKRESLFFSREELQILDANIEEEKYTQKFSSLPYVKRFLKKINIDANSSVTGVQRRFFLVWN